MKNIHSTDGMAEDIIRSFVQVGSAEMHVKTLIEKRVSELENGFIDAEDGAAVARQLERISLLKDELCRLAEMRRADMLYLYRMYGGKGDKEKWCSVKHLGIAMMTAFEAWQASDNDEELLNMFLEKNSAFIKAVTGFLGVEITECASCFSDILKGGGGLK
nr:MAG TPA: hypothetical protein [Caudoviricetes sp.]